MAAMAYHVDETEPPTRDRQAQAPKKKLADTVARWLSRKPAASSSALPPSADASLSCQSPPHQSPRTTTGDRAVTGAFLAAPVAIQTVHPALRPPQIPRSAVSADLSSPSPASKSAWAASVVPPRDLHPVFRAPVVPPMPLSPMREDPERAWSPAELATLAHVAAAAKTPVRDPARLPVFAFSPADKVVIEPGDMTRPAPPGPAAVELVRVHMLPGRAKGAGHGTTVYAVDLAPAAGILASKHGDRTLKIHSLPPPPPPQQQQQGAAAAIATTTTSALQATLRPGLYVQVAARSRDFITSHAVLSAPRALDVFDTPFAPLACYYCGGAPADAVALHAVAANANAVATNNASAALLFGARPARVIDLAAAGLPHTPKLPELAFGSSAAAAPLLVAAAGPRPPRAGHPPPAHGAMLMAWTLGPANARQAASSPSPSSPASSRPWRFALPAHHAQLATALPCGLAAHGGVAVSIWIPHAVRVIGAPGAWQVELVAVLAQWVLVWEMEAAAETATRLFAIPHHNTIACVSPDCRLVAYRQGPGTAEGGGCLVLLDALAPGGREVWRTPRRRGGGCGLTRDCEQLMDLSRVASIAFSADGATFLIGDTSGAVGIYAIRAAAGQDGFGIVLE